MTITIIKPFLLFAITFFLFNKITNTEQIIISRMIKYPFFSILLAVITLFCKQRFSALSYIIPFIVFWLILCFMTSFKAQILFIYALICLLYRANTLQCFCCCLGNFNISYFK